MHGHRLKLPSVLCDLGLQMVEVEGDGHCFFRSLAFLCPPLSFRQWRHKLADHVEAKADHDQLHSWYLARFNDISAERPGGKQLNSFEALIHSMRNGEWGYSDWITEFSALQQVQVVVVDHQGHLASTRHRSVSTVRHTYFIVNQATQSGP